jgi:hypothetical protein
MFFNGASLNVYTVLSAITSNCQFILRQTCHRKVEQADQAEFRPEINYQNSHK